MKITNSFILSKPLINNNVSKTNSVKNDTSNQKTDSKLICPTELYQVYNNISFGSQAKIKPDISSMEKHPYFVLMDNQGNPSKIVGFIMLNSGGRTSLNINQDIIEKFLKDENGNIDNGKVQQYISVYQYILQDITTKDEEADAFLASILKGEQPSPKKSKVEYLNPNDEAAQSILSSLSVPEDDFVYAFFNGIKNEEIRKEYASHILQQTDRTPDVRSEKAMNRTIIMLNICKTNDGFDFCNLPEKMKLVKTLESIQLNYCSDDSKDYAEEIINASKSEKGAVDINFAQALCRLITDTEIFSVDSLVTHRSGILKSFINMDNEHSSSIIQDIMSLSSLMEVDDENSSFEDAFFQAFNPKTQKYDSEAAALLLELVPFVMDKIEEMPLDSEDDYEKYVSMQNDIINGYFETVRDVQTGKIKQNHISPKDYTDNIDLK